MGAEANVDSIGGLLTLHAEAVERLMSQPDSARFAPNETVRWVCTMVSRKGTARLLMRCTSDLLVNVLVFDKIQTHHGFVPALVSATGPDLASLGDNILTAAALEPAEVSDHLKAGSYTYGQESLHGRQDLRVDLEVWRTTALPATLLAVHADNVVRDKDAHRLALNAVTPYARPLVPMLVLDKTRRDLFNSTLGTDAVPAPLPLRGAVVVQRDADGSITFPARELIKEAAAGRRLAAAVRTSLRRGATATAQLQLPGSSAPDLSAAEADAAEARSAAEAAEARASAAEAEVERLSGLLEGRERDLRDARREAAALASSVTPEPAPAERPAVVETATSRPPAARPPEPVEEPAAFAAPAPASFAALLSQARETLVHVVVPAHLDSQAQPLQSDPKAARWVERTWAILLSLEGYAAARRAGEAVYNLRDYLATADQPLIPQRQVALGESDQVRLRSKYREARTFPVSAEVDPTGKVFFAAHVRVESSGRGLAPRLYYFDDLGGATRQIHLGYLGPHLVNTRTN